MCVCIYTYIHAYIHLSPVMPTRKTIYIHIYTHTYTYIYIHTCIHTWQPGDAYSRDTRRHGRHVPSG